MNKTLLLCSLIALSGFIAGCSKDSGSMSASSGEQDRGRFGTGAAPSESADGLLGEWEGKPELDSKKPEEALAAGLLAMMGDVDLELKEGNRFEITMIGIPMEGSFTVRGKTLTLKPETALGKTADELEKLQTENNVKGDMREKMKPMDLRIADDGKSLYLDDPKDSSNRLVFKRPAPKAPGKSTVTASERSLVGEYRAKIDEAELQKQKETERAMIEAMVGAMKLELNEDNTFKMNMIINMDGTWKLENGKVQMIPTSMMGATPKTSDKVTLEVQNGVLFPLDKGKRVPFTFVKKP